MALFSKDNLMKAGVIVVVLAFMFEVFAFGGGGRPAEEGLPFEDGNASAAAVSGVAIVEGTVSSYERELYVFGADAEALAVIEALQEEGKVQYTAPGPGGSTVLNLARSANVSEIAALLGGTNATMVARAKLRMPVFINFTTSQGEVGAAFQDVIVDMEPSVPIGQNVSVRVTASIAGGLVTSYSAVPVSLEISFSAKAEVLGYEPAHLVLASVAWENRAFDDELVRQEFLQRYPEGMFSLDRNSSVLVLLEDVEFEQGYVVAYEPGMLVINESFMDRRGIEDDLLSAGVVAPARFPGTTLLLAFEDEGSADLSFLEGLVNYTSMADYRQALLGLPETVELDNRTFELDERTLGALIPEEPVGAEVELGFRGDLFAGRLSNIEVEEEG